MWVVVVVVVEVDRIPSLPLLHFSLFIIPFLHLAISPL